MLLPVGHYQGAVHPGGGRPPIHYLVRLGWEPVQLDEESIDVWGHAHGLPDVLNPTGVWGRPQLLAAAAMAGTEDAEEILERLLDRGLVVELEPGTAEAREFARYHRVQPLLIGLGQIDDGLWDAIGLPGRPVALRAWPRVREVWEWAYQWPTLEAACEALADAALRTGGTDPSETDPEGVLTYMLGALQTLIAHGAAYLDHRPSWTPWA